MARARWSEQVLGVRASDGASVPLDSANVYVYEFGTTTPVGVAIFAADTGSSTKSNPFTTNAAGEFEFFLDQPRRVTIKVTKSGYSDITINRDVPPPPSQTATLTDQGFVVPGQLGTGTPIAGTYLDGAGRWTVLPTSGTPLPTTPTGLQATGGDAQIQISWSPSTNHDYYEVLSRLSADTDFTIVATGVGSTSYLHTGLPNGITRVYRVRAVKAGVGSSPDSQEAQATTAAAGTVPDAPTGLSAQASGSAILLQWQPTSGTYSIYRTATPGSGYSLLVANWQGASYTDSAASADTTYEYYVIASNAIGDSSPSNLASAFVPSTSFTTFDDELTADAPDSYWKLDEDSGTTFADGPGSSDGTLTGTGSTLNVTGPLAGGQDTGALQLNGSGYVATADIIDAAGTASMSGGVWVKPTLTPGVYMRVVSKEDDVTAGVEENGWVVQISPAGQVQWIRWLGTSATFCSSPSNIADGVWTYIGFTYDGTNMRLYLNGILAATVASALSLTNNTLAIDIGAHAEGHYNTYRGVISRLWLKAGSAVAVERYLAHYTAGTSVPPEAGTPPQVTGLVLVAGDGQIAAQWAAASGATSYVLRYGTSSGVYTQEIAGILATSRTITGLVNGTAYYVVCLGENNNGRGPQSSQQSATPVATVVGTGLQDQITAIGTGEGTITAGVYRESAIVSSAGARIIIPAGVEILGSNDWSTGGASSNTWTLAAGVWTSSLTVPTAPTTSGNPLKSPQSNWPESVFLDRVEQVQVSTGTTPTAGQFALDSSRRVILGSDPTGKLIEVTVRQYGIRVDASDVTIRGSSGPDDSDPARPRSGGKLLHFFGAGYQHGGAIDVDARGAAVRDRVKIKWLELGYAHWTVVGVYGSEDAELRGNFIHNGGICTVDIGEDFDNSVSGVPNWGFTIADNEIAFGNTQRGNGGWHSAIMKITMTGGRSGHPAVMKRNRIHGALNCSAVWMDTYCPGWTIGGATAADGNYFYDVTTEDLQYLAGLRVEITDGSRTLGGNASDVFLIRNNSFYRAANGLFIDNSEDITIQDNVFAWCTVSGADLHWFYGRQGGAGDMVGVDYDGPMNVNLSSGNQFITVQAANRWAIRWRSDNEELAPNPAYVTFTDASNVDTNSKYAFTTSAGVYLTGSNNGEAGVGRYQTRGYQSHSTIAGYNGTSWGAGATYMTASEMSALLAARGIPSTPT